MAASQVLRAAGLESQVIVPSDPKYGALTQSYFDNSAKLKAACYVQPRNADETRAAIKALAAAGQRFAVRAGGYTTRAASSNIEGGVTIDLCLLSTVEYDARTETAHLGPGANWQQVYDVLEKHNRIVGGGRVANVGVGGYLLGGGMSIFQGRHGFAFDSVVGYEVVLADGAIVTATSEQHLDLFQALKGGGNNFGIVTRFTIKTYPIKGPVWGGVALKGADVAPAAAQALEEFTTNASNDPDSTMILVVCHQPPYGGDGVLTLTFNAAGVEKPKAFSKFMEFPDAFSSYKSGKIQELLPFSELPLDHYNIWYTLTFKNDASIITKASELLYQMAKEFQAKIPSNEFATHVAFQPVPRLFTEKSIEFGGNMIGLDRYPHDAILLQVSASVKTAELAEWASVRANALLEDVRIFAGNDRLSDWLYLNYAHASQNVLEGYGPDNVRKIREAAAKYDPEGVFQKLCPGGFKISAVKE